MLLPSTLVSIFYRSIRPRGTYRMKRDILVHKLRTGAYSKFNANMFRRYGDVWEKTYSQTLTFKIISVTIRLRNIHLPS